MEPSGLRFIRSDSLSKTNRPTPKPRTTAKKYVKVYDMAANINANPKRSGKMHKARRMALRNKLEANDKLGEVWLVVTSAATSESDDNLFV